MEKEFVNVRLEVIPVYTFTGIKTLYKLGDMAYGQFLIFKNRMPYYYFDVFDELYKELDGPIMTETNIHLYKMVKAAGPEFKMGQGIRGVWSSKIKDEFFELEKLPVSFIKRFA